MNNLLVEVHLSSLTLSPSYFHNLQVSISSLYYVQVPCFGIVIIYVHKALYNGNVEGM